jgi:hypothetical protein
MYNFNFLGQNIDLGIDLPLFYKLNKNYFQLFPVCDFEVADTMT